MKEIHVFLILGLGFAAYRCFTLYIEWFPYGFSAWLEEKRRKDKVIAEADNLLATANRFLTPCFVVDSNIWMNNEYDPFFFTLEKMCQRAGYRLTLSGTQFDEIANIKKHSGYAEKKNQDARLAISRIDHFHKLYLLTIESLTVDSQRGAYADPQIVKTLLDEGRKGITCTFVSDDKELRIRVREHLASSATAAWTILEMDDFLPKCRVVQESFLYR